MSKQPFVIDNQKITFKKALKADKDLVHGWLKKPHVKEYWDNSEEMWENFENYLKGHKVLFDYWICYYDKEPFALIITSDASEPESGEQNTPDHFVPWLEPEGMTLTIDFAIGEKSFLGKGFSAVTLKRFAEVQDPSVTAFLVDPEVKNERATHVYDKAGFVKVGTFIRGKGFFKGKPHYLMKKKLLH
jgi:RimJ/RimL family protein N-acetyltransferase